MCGERKEMKPVKFVTVAVNSAWNAAIMGNRMEMPQKIKNRTAI